LSGNVDRYSPVEISGQVNLLSPPCTAICCIKFQNMELTDISTRIRENTRATASGKES
jgi:hypothetical protein